MIRKKLLDIKDFFIFLLYRCLRANMVLRMKYNGFSWTKINQVLRLLHQKQIVQVIHNPEGMLLKFEHVEREEKIEFDSKGNMYKKLKEPPVEVIDNKNKQTNK